MSRRDTETLSLSVVLLAAACGPAANGADGGVLPMGTCDMAALAACKATLTASDFNGGNPLQYACQSWMANEPGGAASPAHPNDTLFHISTPTPPPGLAEMNLWLNFSGPPAVGRRMLLDGDFTTVITTASRIYDQMSPTTISLVLSEAIAMQGATTQGDYCLHGTLDAPLSARNPAGNATLHVEF